MSVPRPARHVVQDLADDAQHVAVALARRQRQLDAIGEDDQADLVVVGDRRVGEQRGDLGGELLLELRAPSRSASSALASTSSMTVSSRSSVKRLTCGTPVRAVTFQSIVRTSSPGRYSRTSANSMPRPLKTLWYWPANRSLTRWLVRIWILRTAFSCSQQVSMVKTWNEGDRLKRAAGVSVGASGRSSFNLTPAPCSGHRHSVEDALHDRVRRHAPRLRPRTEIDDAVAEHVGADRLDVLRRDVAAAVDEARAPWRRGVRYRVARGERAVLNERARDRA